MSKYLQIKNERYYKKLVEYYNKNKKVKLTTKLNFVYKIGILLDKAGVKTNIIINPYSIILLSVLCFIVFYLGAFNIFKVVLLSVITSIPGLFLPAFVLNLLAEYRNSQIEKVMLDFLLQLKNYTQLNNDIIFAFKQVKTLQPLQGYIDMFLLEINSGIKFEKATESVKERIGFEKLKSVFENIEYCYIYGGSFSELMDKSYKIISKIQKEKFKRMEETKSARIILGILIFLDVFIYLSFIRDNPENLAIMTKRFVGNLIIYWNFISIWILVFLMHRVKKLDY